MTLPLLPEAFPRSRRGADDVRLSTSLDGIGRLGTLRVDLRDRPQDRHCLVALPSFAWDGEDDASPTWLRLEVAYDDRSHEREPVPFLAMVNWYEDGDPVKEERLRFFASSEPTTICLPLQPEEHSDRCQVTLYADRSYRGRLTVQSPHVVARRSVHWLGAGSTTVEPFPREKQWRQKGRHLTCSSFFGEHYAVMPEGWRLEDVHPAALAAAEWFLYDRLEADFLGLRPSPRPQLPAGPRPTGGATLLSFSLGTDSTAAAALLPETTQAYYSRRDYDAYRLANGAPAALPDASLYEAGLGALPGVLVVPTTFERIPLAAGRRHGYVHGYGYAALGLLLADHVDAGALAFGSVMEQVFLRSGNHYTDVVTHRTSLYNSVAAALADAGLVMTLPTAGCSEVLTSRIAREGRYPDIAISCPQPGPDGAPCGTCFKCFRKLRIDGVTDAPDPAPAVLEVLGKRPLKSGTSVVYACQKAGFQHPTVEPYLEADVSFLDRYLGHAVDHMVPEHLRGHVRAQLEALGIEPMDDEDEARLRGVTELFSS